MKKPITLFINSKKSPYARAALRLQSVPGSGVAILPVKKKGGLFKRLSFPGKSQIQTGYRPESSCGNRLGVKFIGVLAIVCLIGLFLLADVWGHIKSGVASIRIFQVNTIVVEGNRTVPTEKLRNATGVIPYRTSLLQIDVMELEHRLSAVPLVSAAKVTKNYPSTLEISIVENVPIALLHREGKKEGGLFYLTKEGHPFMRVPPGGEVDFPVITGLFSISDKNVRQRAMHEALVFLKRTGRNDPHLPLQSVSEINVTGKGELIIYLVEYPFPIFFGTGDTSEKYKKLVRVLRSLYKRKKGEEPIERVEYILMDYMQDKVLVAQSGTG